MGFWRNGFPLLTDGVTNFRRAWLDMRIARADRDRQKLWYASDRWAIMTAIHQMTPADIGRVFLMVRALLPGHVEETRFFAVLNKLHEEGLLYQVSVRPMIWELTDEGREYMKKAGHPDAQDH
jgi:hypothetical protein